MADGGAGADRVAWGWLAGLALVVVLVVAAASWVDDVSDVMIDGAPVFGDDELRARPTLEEVMPSYVGALEAVGSAVLAAEERAGSADVVRYGEGGPPDDDAWVHELDSWFEPATGGGAQQVVDGLTVRSWRGSADVEGALAEDAWTEVSDDLLVVVAAYGFRPSERGTRSEGDARLLDVHDEWGASLLVRVEDDLGVSVFLTTGLHLSSGSSALPEGAAPSEPPSGAAPAAG